MTSYKNSHSVIWMNKFPITCRRYFPNVRHWRSSRNKTLDHLVRSLLRMVMCPSERTILIMYRDGYRRFRLQCAREITYSSAIPPKILRPLTYCLIASSRPLAIPGFRKIIAFVLFPVLENCFKLFASFPSLPFCNCVNISNKTT